VSVPPRSRGALQARAERSYVVRGFLLPVQKVIHTEQTSGIVLLGAAVLAIVWANSPWSATYEGFWHTPAAISVGPFGIAQDIRHWVNDGLMALFFYVVGLEIKHELREGQLAHPRQAALPAAGALGGMLVPAAIYLAFNIGGPWVAGWGVPMATDIAFALGVVALLGRRISVELRVFLLALSIVDDLGAILVIAIFYTQELAFGALGLAGLIVLAIMALNRLGSRNQLLYVVGGLALWVAVYSSGVHATVAGVVLAFLTPGSSFYSRAAYAQTALDLVRRYQAAERNDHEDRADDALGQMEEITQGTESPLDRLQRVLQPWTSYVVLPIFALANAGVPLSGDALASAVGSSVTIGIAAGLLIGKPVGIFLLTWLACQLHIAVLPSGARWRQIAGLGMVAGIGFTVSLFIAGLAFADEAALNSAKLAILGASAIAGAMGFLFLLFDARRGAT
jgi:NhaA family Na+:H+ antiporter